MSFRPPAPMNSITGALCLFAFVILSVAAYRKFAPAALTAHVAV